jgi:NADH-quinone oxidoreductase subunit I
MMSAIKEIFTGFWSLLVGMSITLRQFFKPVVTVPYPRATLNIPPLFRGHIELVRDPQTGKAICFACKLCEKACPSHCITVEGAKLEGAKKRSVTAYKLDFSKCSLCGSCVEACRDGCIRFSNEYNNVYFDKNELVMDLFKRLEEESKRAGFKSEVPSPKAEVKSPVPAPKAEGENPKTEIRDPKENRDPKSEGAEKPVSNVSSAPAAPKAEDKPSAAQGGGVKEQSK